MNTVLKTVWYLRIYECVQVMCVYMYTYMYTHFRKLSNISSKTQSAPL